MTNCLPKQPLTKFGELNTPKVIISRLRKKSFSLLFTDANAVVAQFSFGYLGGDFYGESDPRIKPVLFY